MRPPYARERLPGSVVPCFRSRKAQRAALQLVCFEQLSYEAAADRLAVPLADLKENLLSAGRLIMARLQ